MHVGHIYSYPTKYHIAEGNQQIELTTVSEEKDLGVFTTSDLRPSRQSAAAASKASSVLGLIKRNFKRLDKTNFLLLYKAYVRPHLEYCVQAWNPFLMKDIRCLESVQRRATQLVTGFRYKPYEERLRLLRLTTLEKRRARGDLNEAYKIIIGREAFNKELFFQPALRHYDLRGHSLKMFKPRCHSVLRRSSFSLRIVDEWNSLPESVVTATSVNDFKNKLDKFWNTDMVI